MNRIRTLLLLTLVTILSACDKTGAFGDETSIIAAMEPELWSVVEDDVKAALEPTIYTVRDERAFTVTYQEPNEEAWGRLRQFKQLLLVGTGDEPFLEEVMDRVDQDNVGPRPHVLQLRNVWARGQLATLVLLPGEDDVEAFTELLPDLGELYDEQYRRLATARMFVSGADSALADGLREEEGFSLLLPEVYYWDRQDSVFIFRNDNPDPSELIRQITVTWQTPIPDELDGEEILAWRDRLSREYYRVPQVVDLSEAEAGPFYHERLSAYQVQAVWQNPPDGSWPAAGPFILWAVACPAQDRLYLLDAWLYAPGREKYQYMIQLQTVLESFRCGD